MRQSYLVDDEGNLTPYVGRIPDGSYVISSIEDVAEDRRISFEILTTLANIGMFKTRNINGQVYISEKSVSAIAEGSPKEVRREYVNILRYLTEANRKDGEPPTEVFGWLRGNPQFRKVVLGLIYSDRNFNEVTNAFLTHLRWS